MKNKRKLRSLEEIYRRTPRLDENPAVNFGEEDALDPLLQEQECPSATGFETYTMPFVTHLVLSPSKIETKVKQINQLGLN